MKEPHGDELPPKGFDPGTASDIYQEPPADGSTISVNIDPRSHRLQFLSPFDKWDGNDFTDMAVLIKVCLS